MPLLSPEGRAGGNQVKGGSPTSFHVIPLQGAPFRTCCICWAPGVVQTLGDSGSRGGEHKGEENENAA